MLAFTCSAKISSARGSPSQVHVFSSPSYPAFPHSDSARGVDSCVLIFSQWETMRVHQLVKGIREGRIVVNPKKKVEEDSYGIWKDDDDIPEK